jgi:hypothetical protein
MIPRSRDGTSRLFHLNLGSEVMQELLNVFISAAFQAHASDPSIERRTVSHNWEKAEEVRVYPNGTRLQAGKNGVLDNRTLAEPNF